MRILWNSWSRIEAEFELGMIKNLPLKRTWLNAYQNAPQPGDIWLTTNGYNHKHGNFKKMTWYAESYTYLPNEYNRYDQNTGLWDLRFHFNPAYYNKPKSRKLAIHTHWREELKRYSEWVDDRNRPYVFGMVAAKKPPMASRGYIGPFRDKVVEAGRGRSFIHYGPGWDSSKEYRGQAYIRGNRNHPIKFQDARELMKQCKFVFAIENTYDQVYSMDYMTEKIFHGFLSGGVPIYLGCWNIEKLVPENCFIDLRKFGLDVRKVMDFCEKMSDDEYDGYLLRINEFLEGSADGFSCDSRFLEIDSVLSQK